MAYYTLWMLSSLVPGVGFHNLQRHVESYIVPCRRAFLYELGSPNSTLLTSKFNASLYKSYYVEKYDLTEAIGDKKNRLPIVGVLLVGPFPGDPFWTINVAAFLREGDGIRVNLLVYSHARITEKRTAMITKEQYRSVLNSFVVDGLLYLEQFPRNPKEPEVLLVQYDKTGQFQNSYSGSLSKGIAKNKIVSFDKAYNKLYEMLKATYP